MPDFHKLEGTIPVAPLSLIVMESAKELGNSVDNYISQFRHELYKMPENDPAFHGYVKIAIKSDTAWTDLEVVKRNAPSTRVFEAMMSTFLRMSATTVSPIRCTITLITSLLMTIIRILSVLSVL